MSVWLPNFDSSSLKPNPVLWDWMQTRTSITEKAQSACQEVELKLLHEAWTIKEDSLKVFIREINILCNGKVAWYARTEIPEITYNLRNDKFERLKEKPIGNILYHDPEITRGNFEYAYLNQNAHEYQWATNQFQPLNQPLNIKNLWARKSIFWIQKNPLYLLEVFFPAELFNNVNIGT